MQKEEVNTLLKQRKLEMINIIVKEYLEETGMENVRTRERKYVEHRNALINSMSRYSVEEPTAEALGRHRTTVYHSIKSHNMYYNYSPLYRRCFSISEKIVDKYATQLATISHTLLAKKSGGLRKGRKASQLIMNSTSKSNMVTNLQVKIDEYTKIIDDNIVVRATYINKLEEITDLDKPLIGDVVK